MRLMLTSLALLPIAAAGCAPTPAQTAAAADRAVADQAGLAAELAGLTPERGAGCITPSETRDARSIKAYGPTIVYVVGPNLKYRTDTTGGCDRIARGDALVTVANGGQLCRGDIGRTIDTSSQFETGSCGFGDFVRYSRTGK